MRRSFVVAGALCVLALPGTIILALSKPFSLSVLVPIGLTAVSIPIGLVLGPRVGFRSLILNRLSGQPTPGISSGVVWAAAGAPLIGLLWVIPARMLINVGLVESTLVFPASASVLKSFFIGAIPEELIFRWCGMSLGVYILWKRLERDPIRPGAPVYWFVLVSTAAVFALAHSVHVLRKGSSPADPYGLFLIGTTFFAGMVFGWVFWKKDLEYAIAAQGLGNLAIWLLSWFR